MVEKVYTDYGTDMVVMEFGPGDKTETNITQIEMHLRHMIELILDVYSTVFNVARNKVITEGEVEYMFRKLGAMSKRVEEIMEMLKEIADKMGLQT